MAYAQQPARHHTSIVDISELEDDEGCPQAAACTEPMLRPGGGHAHAGPQLYLFHEDGLHQHPHQRLPALLSAAPGSDQREPASAAGPQPRQGLVAIDWPGSAPSPSPVGHAYSDMPGTRPVTPAPCNEQASRANLGTISGVYFPCLQNIFGVILFIRMAWIVGTAGIPTAFSLVFICCSVTLTTSISLSAIATNGIVPAGGSYFMISRSLGPECGGAVGTMFFLGTTFAGAMYITGAVEIMLNYLAPHWGLFGDFQRDVSILYHNIRVYGSVLLIILGCLVWIGMRFVSKLAPFALLCVLVAIMSIYVGVAINYNGRTDQLICVMGDRLVHLKHLPYEEPSAAELMAGQLHQPAASEAHLHQQLNLSSASKNELETQKRLHRMRNLCTFEKLRYAYCPGQQQQQPNLFESRNQDNQDSQPAAEPLELIRAPPNMSNCDPYFKANKERIRLERAVPGIASGVYQQNLAQRFRRKRDLVSLDEGVNTNPSQDYNNIIVDITTSFTILISIYFPSCTGILAGSNRSGDLADAQKSIPRGTLAAQLTTSFVYLSFVLMFGSTFHNLFIRDKFGEASGGLLAVTTIAWPHPYIILIGGLFSTLGAALQSLVGAPRVLQGIARDEVIPCFKRFAKQSARGEPELAILFTLGIAWFAVMIGNLDFIAPILTLSLVMCYFFINLACTLHSLLGSPNWRPRFKHYHWSISTLGCFLCLFVMIVSSWMYFIVAIFLAGCIYKYIEFHGALKEWGDGKQGLALSAARYNLLRLKTSEQHTKNWRPQVLLFCKLKPTSLAAGAPELSADGQQQLAVAMDNSSSNNQNNNNNTNSHNHRASERVRLAHPKLLTFASQLKAGKGLTLVSAIIEGDFKELAPLAARARHALQERMQAERVKGFADVLVAHSIQHGLSYQIQTAGLGGLKHNTVIVGWPERWRRPLGSMAPAPPGCSSSGAPPPGSDQAAGSAGGRPTRPGSFKQPSCRASGQTRQTRAHLFIELLRDAQASQNSLLVMKGVDSWPESCDKLGGFIDIWWIVNDGGLLMLLPHLLKQHRTWKSCQLRIFTVAQAGDNVMQMRADLAKFLYHLRIEAQVDIVEMNNSEISDYAYERTLMMEQRAEIMKRLNLNRRQSLLLEQEVDGRLIRFRIRKPSLGDFDECSLSPSGQNIALAQLPAPSTTNQSLATDSLPGGAQSEPSGQSSPPAACPKPDETNVRRMHTALTLNEAILKRSRNAKLVIINLPGAPKQSSPEAENNYMEFIEIITDKLERVLLVQNGGREVITIHS